MRSSESINGSMLSELKDSQMLGFVVGILAPVLGFFAYASIYTSMIRPHLTMDYFVNEMFLGTDQFQSPILSLSMIALIPLFFLFNHLNKPKTMRGMLSAMFVLAALIVVLWL